MNADTLKPCPFCGGEAKTFGPYGWYRQYGISHSCPTFYNGSSEMSQGFNSEKTAIAAWNTRAADNIALQAEVERLREALEDIATGDGVYGAQAHEYKTLARAALNT